LTHKFPSIQSRRYFLNLVKRICSGVSASLIDRVVYKSSNTTSGTCLGNCKSTASGKSGSTNNCSNDNSNNGGCTKTSSDVNSVGKFGKTRNVSVSAISNFFRAKPNAASGASLTSNRNVLTSVNRIASVNCAVLPIIASFVHVNAAHKWITGVDGTVVIIITVGQGEWFLPVSSDRVASGS